MRKGFPYGKKQTGSQIYRRTKQEKIQQLARAVAETIGVQNYRMFDCDALIIISFDENDGFGVYDSSVAIQNIYLAAHSLGLGSVWINQLRGKCGEPKIRKVLDSFNIPPNHIVCGISALGYPAETPAPKVRTETVEFVR